MRILKQKWQLWLIAVAMVACQTGGTSNVATPEDLKSTSADTDSAAAAQSTPAAPPPAPEGFTTAHEGTISRAELQEIIQRGPQDFISRITVRPTFKRNRFFGWRVTSYSGPGRLEKGDIIVSINNKPLEKPEQFMEVWEALDKQHFITIDMVRGGEAMRLTFRITD